MHTSQGQAVHFLVWGPIVLSLMFLFSPKGADLLTFSVLTACRLCCLLCTTELLLCCSDCGKLFEPLSLHFKVKQSTVPSRHSSSAHFSSHIPLHTHSISHTFLTHIPNTHPSNTSLYIHPATHISDTAFLYTHPLHTPLHTSLDDIRSTQNSTHRTPAHHTSAHRTPAHHTSAHHCSDRRANNPPGGGLTLGGGGNVR